MLPHTVRGAVGGVADEIAVAERPGRSASSAAGWMERSAWAADPGRAGETGADGEWQDEAAMDSRTAAPRARAAFFAAVCTLLAVAAHLPMSQGPLPAPAVAGGAVAVFGLAWAAAVLGERGLGSISLLVGASQFGLHLLFQAAQSMAGSTSSPNWAPMPGMDGMTGMDSMPGMPAMTGMAVAAASRAPVPPMGMSWGMTAAHVLAALVAAWWLRRGEAAVFAVAGRTRALLRASWRVLTWWAGGAPTQASTRRQPSTGAAPHRSTVSRLVCSVMARRGPPASHRLRSFIPA